MEVEIPSVGSMLAHFSLLGAFFSFLAASCAFVRRFLLMLVVFFAFWVAPGPILERPGTILEVRNLIFRGFVARAGLQCENIAHVQKPCFFVGFCMVLTHRKHCAQATQRRKIVPGACRTDLPAKIVLKTRLGVDSGRVWRSLGRHLAGFCPLLGGSWPLLGASWASIGHFLGALGCLLAALCSFRAAFWLPGSSQGSILEGLGTSQTGF